MICPFLKVIRKENAILELLPKNTLMSFGSVESEEGGEWRYMQIFVDSMKWSFEFSSEGELRGVPPVRFKKKIREIVEQFA